MIFIEEGVVSQDSLISIIISRFNEFINQNLLNGAINTLKRIGQIKEKNISIIKVPGAYELTLIAKNIANLKKYDAIIALGTIIKGNTSHFMHIAHEVSSGLARISLENNIPISFGILTTDNIEQAIERSGAKMGNKGIEAALCALEMINIIQTIKKII
ncbi:6,7-dimethyl-8-ribityllumazine synthase [Buchnera aphidicola]|uniref:6,7-dimethyl-8-ribityllumazine synthase n=1 Tax=Buchnera aphidicola TaxID=9 RepID=UPI0034647C39